MLSVHTQMDQPRPQAGPGRPSHISRLQLAIHKNWIKIQALLRLFTKICLHVYVWFGFKFCFSLN